MASLGLVLFLLLFPSNLNCSSAKGFQVLASMKVPRSLPFSFSSSSSHLKLELLVSERLPCSGVDESDEIVFVPNGDVVPVRRPANVDVVTWRRRRRRKGAH